MPDPQDQFAASIASEAVEILEDHVFFPSGYLLPLSARGSGVPGMADRPWSRLTADVFYPNLPVIYSLAFRREPPDVLRGSLRARRTLFEGFMMALAEKTGRRPSLAWTFCIRVCCSPCRNMPCPLCAAPYWSSSCQAMKALPGGRVLQDYVPALD